MRPQAVGAEARKLKHPISRTSNGLNTPESCFLIQRTQLVPPNEEDTPEAPFCCKPERRVVSTESNMILVLVVLHQLPSRDLPILR